MTGFWGGKEGEPVPQVDPSDLKALWKLGEDMKNNPQGRIAIGVNLMPTANLERTLERLLTERE
jgi:hypothetical protein